MIKEFRNWTWKRAVKNHYSNLVFESAMLAYLINEGKSPSVLQQGAMRNEANLEADNKMDEWEDEV